MVLQDSLDHGEVEGEAVDLILYPATRLRDLSERFRLTLTRAQFAREERR